MKGQVLTIVLLSSTYANPLLDLNLEDKTENKIKNKITSSSFDAKDQPEVTSGSGEESLGRYLALVSSIGSWLGGVQWKKYGDYSHHLTLPGSGLPIYLNGTSATFNAVLGNLAAVGLTAYLVSQLPSSGRFRAGFRSDDDYDDYSLDRDQEYDSLGFEDEEYDDYEYSESDNGWGYNGENSPRVKKDRIGGGRKPRWQRRRPFRRHYSPGPLERLANLVSQPIGAMARMSQAVNNPAGFLKQFAERYDAYWEKRRGVGRGYESYESRPRPRLRYSPLSDNSRYSPQYRTDEGSGAQLPLEKSSVNDPEDNGAPHVSTGWEDFANAFDFGKQIRR